MRGRRTLPGDSRSEEVNKSREREKEKKMEKVNEMD